MNKKELIIIVYKINVEGLSRQRIEAEFHKFQTLYNLSDDLHLKNDYSIREIWMPVYKEESDVKVIYPILPKLDNDLSKLIKTVTKFYLRSAARS